MKLTRILSDNIIRVTNVSRCRVGWSFTRSHDVRLFQLKINQYIVLYSLICNFVSFLFFYLYELLWIPIENVSYCLSHCLICWLHRVKYLMNTRVCYVGIARRDGHFRYQRAKWVWYRLVSYVTLISTRVTTDSEFHMSIDIFFMHLEIMFIMCIANCIECPLHTIFIYDHALEPIHIT